MSHLRRSSQRDSLLIDGCIMMSHISVDHPNERRRRSFFFLYRITCSDGQLLVVCCLCELSKRNGFVSVGSLLALFRLFDYRARPEFCVCEPWGSLSLSLAFSFPTLAGVGQPVIHELNIQGIRLCVSRPSHSTVRRR